DAVERSAKPVVAAVHSVCMGGGLELALGCHYRVASPRAQIALPEVKLGILPGAGGTQRLPRAVGLETALDMIVSGTPVSSEKLAGTGMFDQLIEGDLLAGAISFAARIANVRPLPKLRDVRIVHQNYETLFEDVRNKVAASSGRFPAPLKCVEAVWAAVTQDFERGLKFERSLFMELVQTPESKALRHAFFSERSVGKIPGVPVGTPARPIKTAAIIGAGFLGTGIAMSIADAGIPVALLDMEQESLDKGLATIRKNYEGMMAKGALTQAGLDQRLGMIKGARTYDEISQADIVVEAVSENIDAKEQVFTGLDRFMKPGAILATATSSLDVNRIADFTRRPQDVIGLHFFSPVNVTKLMEIVRGDKTATDVLTTGMALAKRLKKTGVVSGVCDGFIGNRMIGQYFREARLLLAEGALPAQVDKAIEEFGFALGPFRMSDLAGNDVGIKRRAIADQEIVERLIYTLVNEGARILEEGIALRASDIDMVFLKGYGFPLFHGGPMFYADSVGLKNVVAAMERYFQRRDGNAWTPAPLLARLAAEGRSFN
ncbi:MAG: 3-hydroxyacyl-CoA dehydrogenase, partial [Noviherbaspirillum sp.]|nr:3-hydroxyacyl-CoA dehydrogenase [Noviherbaspirillum sp.]